MYTNKGGNSELGWRPCKVNDHILNAPEYQFRFGKMASGFISMGPLAGPDYEKSILVHAKWLLKVKIVQFVADGNLTL